ncbi:MAG: nucleotidyltransferase domain-containing protein [Thermodesulfobacterium geofontis]|uniref:Nucleotidyltransferase domain-containing protein n=1 Tax=Thermodesulfobacterium geofontis TaxID=1295609 RepID=A0A2N7QFM8_9BACT|nr:MAG: nucleotidyltransferase domain-containing protein [Thermodesulfobacterium geofontis]PMP97703.1 MAG: nucleotidyltransferase domain-containing protein [Thermodesulfobacterium geofontis]
MEKEIIKEVIERIFKSANVEIDKIILFGSRARGDYKKYSDWDLLIVTKEELSRKERQRLAYLIRKELAEHFIDGDVIIKSEKEVEKRKDIVGSIIKSAMKEGVTL